MLAWHVQLKKGELGNEYNSRDGLLFFQGRMVVPNSQQLKNAILQMYHDTPVAGHGGFRKTFKAITEVFYWKQMRKDILDYVTRCETCQQTKYSTGKKQGTLQPLPIPSRPWQDINMDFIIGLPNSYGHVAVLVVVDRFTKQAHFIALQLGFTASVVAEKLIQVVIKLHGFPRSIVPIVTLCS